MGRSLRIAAGAMTLIAIGIVPLFSATAFAQTPQLIVDLLTAPQKHWNTTVVVKGHVRTVTPNPPGTNRGTFVFRDSSDADITVVTNELPSIGKEYTLTAIVEQETPDATVPVLKELSRRIGTGAAAPAEPATPKLVPAPKDAVNPAPAPAAPVTPAATPAPAPTTPSPAPAAPSQAPGTEPTIFGLPTVTAYAAIVVLAVLSIALIAMFRPKPAPPAMDPNQATRYVPPKPAPAAAATVVYVDLGADLVITEGPDTGKKFPLTKPRITIGRHGARQNEVELGDQSVSREHAKIIYNPTDQTFNLINESVTNPTRVNGAAVENRLLQPNDLITMGATTIKFVRRNAGPSA